MSESFANWEGHGEKITDLQKTLSRCRWGEPVDTKSMDQSSDEGWRGWGPIQIADRISDGENVTIQLRWVELETRPRGTKEQGSKYSDEDRRAAALSYAIHGNVQKVSRSLDIPATTLYDWRKSEWWVPPITKPHT